jgi:hypothetical protein
MSNSSAGKGDKPRNCFSKKFKENYDLIIWKNTKKEKKDIVITKNKR